MPQRRSIVVTGASSGIGHACALRFASAGWDVIGTMRSGSDAELAAAGVDVRPLELADPDSVAAFAASVLASPGVPDVLLNNAGVLHFCSVEDTSAAKMREVFEVNLFGHIELTKAFLPAMRERGSGLVANVTSLGGRVTFPFFTTYNACKWAMEGFSEGLWHEMRPFGVRVKTIEPGYVATPIWGKAVKGGDESVLGSGPYRPFQEAMARFEASITKRTSAEDTAEEVFRAVTDPSDRLRYPVAAYARSVVALRRLVGDMAFMRFMHGRWMSVRPASSSSRPRR